MQGIQGHNTKHYFFLREDIHCILHVCNEPKHTVLLSTTGQTINIALVKHSDFKTECRHKRCREANYYLARKIHRKQGRRFAQYFAMLLTLLFPSTFTKMLLECECQELIVFSQSGNFASVYFTCTTTYTARLFL